MSLLKEYREHSSSAAGRTPRPLPVSLPIPLSSRDPPGRRLLTFCAFAVAALASDYNRLLQAPLCCESRYLPDGDTLHDRMLAIGFQEGMASGIDGRAAGLLNGAMEVSLRVLSSGS